MKNVYLRKGGYWFSQMIQGKRVWVNLQTSDYAEAIKRTIEVRGNPLVDIGTVHIGLRADYRDPLPVLSLDALLCHVGAVALPDPGSYDPITSRIASCF